MELKTNNNRIGFVFRSNHNFGANLTHYALFHVLTERGFFAYMIDLPSDSRLSLPVDSPNYYDLFVDNPYANDNCEVVLTSHKWELLKLNNCCDAFIVGSDQLWRHYFLEASDYYSTLDWVENNKYKISYATSFGTNCYEGDNNKQEILARKLSRFDAISVREKSGLDILDSLGGITGVNVIDPVFLCAKDVYIKLIEKSKLNTTNCKYVFAYFLDFSNEKLDFSNKFINVLRIPKLKYVADAMKKFELSDNNETDFYADVKVEDWLRLINDSQYVLTDSFHGLCFCIILKKNFYVFTNKEHSRGYARIEDILGKLGLKARIIDPENVNSINMQNIIGKEIDYYNVYEKLNVLIADSYFWLESKLNDIKIGTGPAQFNTSKYGENDEIDRLKDKKLNYETVINRIKTKYSDFINMKIVPWGAGNRFRSNIRLLKEIFDIESVIDSSKEKIGKVYLNSIECISLSEAKRRNDEFAVLITIENKEVIETIRQELNNNNIKYLFLDDILNEFK